MGGSSNTSQQINTAGPWPPTERHLKEILREGERLYENKQGFHPYPGQTWIDPSQETELAWRGMTGLANRGNPLAQPAMGFTRDLIGGGFDPSTTGLKQLFDNQPNALTRNVGGIASGAQGITAGSQLQRILGNDANAWSRFGSGVASGAVTGSGNVNSQLQGILGNNANALQSNAGGIASGDINAGGSINPQLAALLGENADALSRNVGGIASGGRSIAGDLSPQLAALMGQAPSAIGQNAGGIASGAEGLGTEGDYRALLDAQDADFESVVNRTADTLGDQISRQFGGSSFGSPEHTGTIASQIGDVVARMRSDNFAQNQARKQALLGDITGVQGQNLANRLNASTALSGEQGAALAARSGLIGQMGGLANADIANQLNAAGALSGEQAQNRSQQAALLGQMGGLSLADIQNRLGAAGAISSEQAGNRGQQANILGQIGNFGQGDLATRLGAISGLSGEQAGNRSQQANIINSIGGFQGQNIGNQIAAAGALSGEQQAGFSNQRGILGDIAALNQQGLNNRLAGLGVMDQVYGSQYLPYQQLANVGAAREGFAANELQGKIDKHNQREMAPWDRLAQYFGIASGTGAQGNRSITNVSQPSNPLSSILGAGLLGSQLLF
jgi:hypothetical protein